MFNIGWDGRFGGSLAAPFAAMLAVAVPSINCAAVEPPKPGEFAVKVVKDLAYGPAHLFHPGKNKLDLYLPEGAKDFPVLFFIHGGGWATGDRNFHFGLYANVGRAFAKHGIGVVLPSYRLSPLVKHPAHIEDVAKAFAWTHKTIAEYGGRNDQIVVGGQSAGGHLAALLAADPRWLKAEKLTPADIKACIPISGVYRFGEEIYFDLMFPRGAAARKDASPIAHVKSAGPPTLVVYAQTELPTLERMAKEYHQTLKDNQTDAALVRIPGKNHISIVIDIGKPGDPTTAEMLGFIANLPGVAPPKPGK